VGRATTARGDQAFLWSSAAGAIALGTLPGDFASSARHVNSSGQVVGASFGASSTRAFLWTKDDGMQDLGTLPGGDYSQGNGINVAGTVVGVSGSTLGTRAFIWDSAKGMQDLNGLLAPGANVFLAGASAINDLGQIVAWGTLSHGNSNTNKVEMDHDSHAGPVHVFLLTPGK
jgi:probable HAF family extracellular repeat protein